MLVASMNPCPCGFYNHPEKQCTCPPGIVQRYLSKVSGPLLDRIDIHIEVSPISFNELSDQRKGELSSQVRSRVIQTRQIQSERYKNINNIHCNAQINTKLLREFCKIDKDGLSILKMAMERLGLSARAYDRILKVARTIADLANDTHIETKHLLEAIHYRSLDKDVY
jgi:magnesium chelatase family protein